MSLRARRALLKQFAPQYHRASSKRKQLLLDAFADATGYHRRYGMWLLNHAEEVSLQAGGEPHTLHERLGVENRETIKRYQQMSKGWRDQKRGEIQVPPLS